MSLNETQNLTIGNNIFVPFKMKIIFPFSSYKIAILKLQITQKYDVLHKKGFFYCIRLNLVTN